MIWIAALVTILAVWILMSIVLAFADGFDDPLSTTFVAAVLTFILALIAGTGLGVAAVWMWAL